MLAPYTLVPQRVPRKVWIAARVAVLCGTLVLIGALFAGDARALTITWSLLFPLLPGLFAIAPGLWRNICPMAFLNQLPRELGFSRALKRPHGFRTWSFAISIALLLGAIMGRIALFNASATATAVLLAAALAAALIGGYIYEGKGGWCGTICPLAPVQKLYGQRPAVLVPNAYCAPCVGCQAHCYDFNPGAALPSDLYDRDVWSAGHRRFFAGIYPGFVFGYVNFTDFGWAGVIVFPLLSLGIFESLRTFTSISAYLLAVGFGLTALCTYYWYATQTLAYALQTMFRFVVPPLVVTAAAYAVIAGAFALFVASIRLERAYTRAVAEEHVTRVGGADELRESSAAAQGAPVTERSSGRTFNATAQQSLLEAVEAAGIAIESGCRMGMCGADPILVVAGADNLAPAQREERSTLERLGLGPNARLACSCRTSGPVQIDVDPKAVRADAAAPAAAAVPAQVEPSRRIVIVGNGTSGMSAAEHLRRGDAAAAIAVVGDEPHGFYNRMGIGRLIYGRSALEALVLLDEAWYERERIDLWLNTRAVTIRRDERVLELATGESLPYDVLILATGAAAAKPAIAGIDLPGSFVLRAADDAADLRRYAQSAGARRAVVLGGGVLGVEAAEALRRLGLAVTIAVRGNRLMERSIDPTAAAILRSFLEGLGVTVRSEASAASIDGSAHVESITFADGTTLETDLVVSCIGIVPNVDLGRAAGLAIGRGIIVDPTMRTSDPAIYAVGDVAECDGRCAGLWPIGKQQGEIAAAAILGTTHDARSPSDVRAFSHVKLAGIDLRYYGAIDEPIDDALEFAGASDDGQQWRKLRVRDGRIVGAVVVGFPDTAQALAGALTADADLTASLEALRAGDWALRT
jgi:NADPH-dependent 2,4-dienoyl-CoA reductase/sulfur reductase-like enzyme/ferredoxin